MTPETDNRLLLVLRIWQDERDLILAMDSDKIKASRTPTDDEREFIVAHRPQLVELLPRFSTMTRAECQPNLRASYQDQKDRYAKY